MFETSKQEKLAAQRRRELQTIHTSTQSEVHLLRTLMFLGPAGHVQLLGSFQTVNQEEPFVGHWIADATTCHYVSDGSTIDKVECCSGFVMSHREQYHINSVWVGDTLKHLREVKAKLGTALS